MKDVVIDKAAGRIWGRVAVKNCECFDTLPFDYFHDFA
jgi:hypothetical protein